MRFSEASLWLSDGRTLYHCDVQCFAPPPRTVHIERLVLSTLQYLYFYTLHPAWSGGRHADLFILVAAKDLAG
jgi:hypothetical protein